MHRPRLMLINDADTQARWWMRVKEEWQRGAGREAAPSSTRSRRAHACAGRAEARVPPRFRPVTFLDTPGPAWQKPAPVRTMQWTRTILRPDGGRPPPTRLPTRRRWKSLRVAVARQEGDRVRAPEDARPDERRRSGASPRPADQRPARHGAGGESRRKPRGAGRCRARGAARLRAASTSPCRCARAPETRGRIHPITQVDRRAHRHLRRHGLLGSPRVRTSRRIELNFTALNFPVGHPAREMHDTFFLPARSHLGRAQSAAHPHLTGADPHHEESVAPPIRVIIPGRTYRHDSDQTHTPMFHQVEGLVIDRTAPPSPTCAGCWRSSASAFFEVDEVKMRFRPSFFPVHRALRRGRHPVLVARGDEIRFGEGDRLARDPRLRDGASERAPQLRARSRRQVQGFAWGMGIDRIAMLKYGMPDLRAFFEADLRWLEHYGFRPLDLPSLVGGLTG